MWDLERENCIAQLNLPGSSAAAAGSNSGAAAAAAAGAGVEHIATSVSSPLLYAADATGTGEACMKVHEPVVCLVRLASQCTALLPSVWAGAQLYPFTPVAALA